MSGFFLVVDLSFNDLHQHHHNNNNEHINGGKRKRKRNHLHLYLHSFVFDRDNLSSSDLIMFHKSSKIFSSCLLIILLLNTIEFVQASNGNDFLSNISRAANRLKSQLVEFFYRFRAFFIGHSESTHRSMTDRGCGFAVDDEPKIYTKRTQIRSKIRGGEDAIWHTW